MEVDMRSVDAAALTALDANFHRALDAALAEEHERWGGRGRLELDRRLVGHRPAGRVPQSAPIVQTAAAATKALGLPVRHHRFLAGACEGAAADGCVGPIRVLMAAG